jgi:hypothetical protein
MIQVQFIFKNYVMKNTTDKHNEKVNEHNSKLEKLHNEWKQFSKAEISDAMKKAGPDEKSINDYLQQKAQTTE